MQWGTVLVPPGSASSRAEDAGLALYPCEMLGVSASEGMARAALGGYVHVKTALGLADAVFGLNHPPVVWFFFSFLSLLPNWSSWTSSCPRWRRQLSCPACVDQREVRAA